MARGKPFNSFNKGRKMKHTSGAWTIMPGTSAPRICVDGDREWPIVVISSGHSSEGIKANERLIAEAPNMIKFIEKIVKEQLAHKEYGDMQIVSQGQRIIRKVRGEK